MSTEAVTNRNQQLAVSPPVELPIITRAEAMRLLRNAGVNMFSRNAVLLLENAVRGTYTKYVDNAERPSRQTVKYLFRGVMSRQKRNEKFYGVEDRQIYNLLKEVQDSMRPQRADEKIRYQLNLQPLRDWKPPIEAETEKYNAQAHTAAAREKRARLKAERDKAVAFAPVALKYARVQSVNEWEKLERMNMFQLAQTASSSLPEATQRL